MKLQENLRQMVKHIIYTYHNLKVKVANDQEKAQSERHSLSKNRGGKN